MMTNFSDYIVYVDESGDHSMSTINQQYPIFVLAFCIFKKSDYINLIVPRIQDLKFQYWGHDMIVFHENDIRKPRGEFSNLLNPDTRKAFIEDFDRLIREAPFILIACAIHKERLEGKLNIPPNPYHIALEAGLCKLYDFLKQQGQHDKLTHVVLERRGKKEDNDLELEFRRISDSENPMRKQLPYRGLFAGKPTNSCGLQLADMLARPIGRHLLDPSQPNRAFESLKPKFYEYSALANSHPNGLIYVS